MTFTTSPRLQSLEHMMRQVPRYRPDSPNQGVGEVYIGAYGDYLREASYKPADGKDLPWNTRVILMASPFRNSQFERRIQNEILTGSEEQQMIYKSHIHRRIFKQAVRERNTTDRIFQAVLLLLTANRALWNRVKFHVTKDVIRFENFPMNNCTEEEYTLFCCAKDLYTGTRHISVSDLADANVVSAELFRIICSAMTIARYGINGAESQFQKGDFTT